MLLASTAQPPPPAIVAPVAYEVAFGRVQGRVPAGTESIVVSLDGRIVLRRQVGRTRFDVAVPIPPKDVRITVRAVDGPGRGSSASVGPVFGLPAATRPRPPPRSAEDGALARSIRSFARAFGGTCGIYVQNLRTGAGASWNAGARFPAASTIKVAIAVEVIRSLGGQPRHGSRLDLLLRKAIIPSDDRAANDLLVWLGRSTAGGAARVNRIFRELGMDDTDMYGGYIVNQGRIPVRTESSPSFVGKRTTAADLAILMRSVNLAAEGRGRLPRLGFRPAHSRFLLYLLAHAQVRRIDRFLPDGLTTVLTKAGWTSKTRHDAGLVYFAGGSYVAVVLTWSAGGVGTSSDVLAGKVGLAAYRRFRRG